MKDETDNKTNNTQHKPNNNNTNTNNNNMDEPQRRNTNRIPNTNNRNMPRTNIQLQLDTIKQKLTKKTKTLIQKYKQKKKEHQQKTYQEHKRKVIKKRLEITKIFNIKEKGKPINEKTMKTQQINELIKNYEKDLQHWEKII